MQSMSVAGGVLGTLLLSTLGFVTCHDGPPPASAARSVVAPRVVLGTFDSRAVAVAWVRSKKFAEYLRDTHADVDRLAARARRIGDASLVADLGRIGPSLQERIHEQGFSTAPVDEILTPIADRLPAVAQNAGVDAIVSKWQLVHGRATAQTVDVTDAMVALFEPDEQTLATVRQIVATEPAPRGAPHKDH